ncbi:MAG: hypothetical protein IJ736_06835 [Firmicutes bacterium]|nr:hypothetical protein [Bacillota bacterium]
MNKKFILALLSVSVILITFSVNTYAAPGKAIYHGVYQPKEIDLLRAEKELTPLDVSKNAVYKDSFREQLDDNSKVLYDFFEKEIDKTKDGVSAIEFKNDDLSYKLISADQLISDFNYAMGAFNFDHNEVFWFEIGKTWFSYSWDGNGNLVSFSLSLNPDYDNYYKSDFLTPAEVKNISSEINSTINSAVFAVRGKSRYEQIVYFNDFLVDRNEYNRFVDKSQEDPISRTTASSLVLGSTDLDNTKNPVCEGYSRAMKLFCDRLNIPCVLMSGNSHMWNAIQMEDGIWYPHDSTFNDPIISGNPSPSILQTFKNRYTLVGTSTVIDNIKFSTDHTPSGGFLIYGADICVYPKVSQVKYVYDPNKFTTTETTTETTTTTTTETTTTTTTEATTLPAFPLGDADKDDIVSANDASNILNWIFNHPDGEDTELSEQDRVLYDVDKNGVIDRNDSIASLEIILGIYDEDKHRDKPPKKDQPEERHNE